MTVAAFHGCVEREMAALKRLVSRSGLAVCAHLSSLYPMPVGPSADLLEVSARAVETSLSVMVEKGHGGVAGGLSGWEAGMGLGT